MSRKNSQIIVLGLIAIALFLSLNRCAKEMTTLSGGPRDTIPPRPVESEPPNYSVHFDSREVEVQFNEFIQLKEVEQQFLSSPPFEEEPKIRMKGRGFKLEIKSPLKDSTTYTLNFGNAIVDYTEGNPLRNYKYVFSTGPVLDSMEVEGQVHKAFNMKPLENVLVMLYEQRTDSVPFKQIPDYVSRTDEKGRFNIANIRLDTFKIFALNDLNNNYLYDSPQEDIAFVDSAVVFEKGLIEEHDTVYTDPPSEERAKGDTVSGADTSRIDTIIHRKYRGYPAQRYTLRMFNEISKQQYLKSFQRKKPMKLDLIFNRPVRDSLRISLLDTVPGRNWYLREPSLKGDTMTYWLRDTAIYHQEYLKAAVDYQKLDSAGNTVWTTDTLDFSYVFEEGEKLTRDTMDLSSNITKTMDLNKDIRLAHPLPVASVDTAKIRLDQVKQDSVIRQVDFQVKADTLDYNAVNLYARWQPETAYRLQVLPQALETQYEVYHDTLEAGFKTRPEDFYGSLTVQLPGVDSSFVLQLIKPSEDKEKEAVIREKTSHQMKKGKVAYQYLHPGTYQLKLIHDRNGNGEWDTGDYLEHRQPERVRYNPEKIQVKSNWEYDISWKLDANPPKKERSQ